MFCRKCGYENEEDARFCARCGESLEQVTTEVETETPQKTKSNKKIAAIIVVEILLIACAVVSIFVLMGKRKEKQYEQEIVAADRYLEMLNYEEAEAAYLAAIEIDPKQETPYIRLAEIYIVQEQPEKAKEILQQGYEATQSEEIQEKYNLYTYVDEVLVPQIGIAETGKYEITYFEEDNYVKQDEFHEVSGVITSRIKDFDQDGQEELLVAVLKNDEEDLENTGEKMNSVFLQMYEAKQGNVVLCAEMEACTDVFGAYDKESDGIFLKYFNEKIYICGGQYGLRYLFADGSKYMSFVITYENEDFMDYTGDRIGEMGSDFSWNEEKAEEMASKLDSIELPVAAADVRDTYMLRMTYEDMVDDMLFRIEGENIGADSWEFFQTRDAESLGKVELEFWMGQRELEEQIQNSDEEESQASTQEVSEMEWKSIYRDFIIQDKQNMDYTEGWEYVSYDFVYLNEDNIPELFITYQSTAAGCKLVTIYENKVYEEWLSAGGLDYVEKSNIFLFTYGRQGYYGDTIYTLKEGEFVTIAVGEYEALPDRYGAPDLNALEYYWDGNPVTEQEYEQNIEEIIPSESSVSAWEDGNAAYKYEEILEYLK